MTEVQRIVVGLGNPGPEYEGTRHNVGFDVLDHLARHEGLLFRSAKALTEYTGPRAFTAARSFDPDALLVKPETFMNRSGTVVAPLLTWAGLAAEDCLVVYDDLDLPLGKLRLRPHGGAGGHNGMRSLLSALDSDRFPRLRIGIGPANTDPARYVLDRFTPDQRAEIDVSIVQAAEAVQDWCRGGDIEGCMTRFHSRWNQGA